MTNLEVLASLEASATDAPYICYYDVVVMLDPNGVLTYRKLVGEDYVPCSRQEFLERL